MRSGVYLHKRPARAVAAGAGHGVSKLSCINKKKFYGFESCAFIASISACIWSRSSSVIGATGSLSQGNFSRSLMELMPASRKALLPH